MKTNYWPKLKARAGTPLTADEIGDIMQCYGPDAVTRLRASRSVKVEVIGCVYPRQRTYPIKKIYTLTFENTDERTHYHL